MKDVETKSKVVLEDGEKLDQKRPLMSSASKEPLEGLRYLQQKVDKINFGAY